jgi:hypothetical protein
VRAARQGWRHPAWVAVVAFVAFVAVLGTASCTTNVCPPPSVAVSTPTPSVAPSTAASPSGSPGPTSPVALDPSLLAVLPESVDGIAVVESPEAETAALADPELATVGSALVAGLAVDATSGDFVFAAVVRLLPGVMDDGVFRDWRDSYDEGACSQASGVAGNAQAEIDGRTVYIGTCNGGARTYHVWLEAQGLIVSASAAGDHRLGEKLMENLRVP